MILAGGAAARLWLANPGRIPLQISEVQTGAYLDEDDIVRLEDAYHRTCEEASA
jgi:mannose-6-phosphate isomerase-like protein (cupin superfamily)